MATIISYDVDKKHVELKAALLKLNYADRLNDANCPGGFFLPNTMLYHATKSPYDARADIQNICKSLGIRLIRCAGTIWDPNNYAGICGEAHS